ncbi:hypothetical protein H5T51_01280, partial [Candidatus Bathyarchaeota archaeon]|nr:hypothetical protein [Candidatus Bathyarchaeota archaeon]
DCIKATVTEVKTAKQLWREGNESKLIRLGFTLIALPEPTPISETLGGILVAAGVIQKGIKNHALHVEDIPKTFQNLMKELRTLEECLR